MAAVPAPYCLRARNTAPSSENRIHDDAVARRYGFGGGLVPGVTVYAYLTHPVVEPWGQAWLERGTMEVRFLAPFYDGDEVVVEPSPSREAGAEKQPAREAGAAARSGRPEGDTQVEGHTQVVELSASNGEGHICARARALLPAVATAGPDPLAWPVVPLPEPADRPPASREGFRGIDALGSLEATFRADEAARYLEAVGEDLEIYRGPAAVAHPGWLLSLANHVLASNVALGPWIHTGSDVDHLGTVTDGAGVSVRARVAELSERRGHEIVDLDVLMTVGDHAVLRTRHSAIYRLRTPAEGGGDGGS